MVSYSGDAGNALRDAKWSNWENHWQKFSTPDSDNDDMAGTHCADEHGFGWWVKRCSSSVVNMDTNAIWTTGTAVRNVQSSRMLVILY